MIEFTVKTLDSDDHFLRVEDNTTVYGLKLKILDLLGIAIDHQRLIFYGRVLEDNIRLADCGVHGKVLHLVEGPPPGYSRPATNYHTGTMNEYQPGFAEADPQNRERALSPTRTRIDSLQCCIIEIRNLMQTLREPHVFCPFPDLGEDRNPPSFRGHLYRDYLRESQFPEWWLHDENYGFDAGDIINIHTDRLGLMLEPRRRTPTHQRYSDLLTEMMTLERQFERYQDFYITWIRESCTHPNQNQNENPDSAQAPAAPESADMIRRKHQLSSLISEIHHGFAHAHHLVSDVNFVITESGNRLIADPHVPNNNDLASHAHVNVMQSVLGYPRDDVINPPHAQLYLRRSQPMGMQPTTAPMHNPIRHHYQHMGQGFQQQQQARPQYNVCQMGMQFNPSIYRTQNQRIIPFQPMIPHMPYHPSIPRQQVQMIREVGQLPNQDPNLPPQYQLTTEIILQPLTSRSAPLVFGMQGGLYPNSTQHIQRDVDATSRPREAAVRSQSGHSQADRVPVQASNNRMFVNQAAPKTNQTTLRNGVQSRSGTLPNSASIRAPSRQPAPQSTAQEPAIPATGGQNNIRNRMPVTQPRRGTPADAEGMVRRLQQVSQGGGVSIPLPPTTVPIAVPTPPAHPIAAILNLEAAEAELAGAFVRNNPHLHPHRLAEAASIVAAERPRDLNAPMSAATANAIARLAAAQAARAAVRHAAADSMANRAAARAVQVTQQAAATAAATAATTAATAAAANQTAATPSAATANASTPSAPPESSAPQPNAAPTQQRRCPPQCMGSTVHPTVLYVYDRFLLCHSNHARQQLVRRRQRWEEMRRALHEQTVDNEVRRGLRERHSMLGNEAAIESLIRTNRPAVLWESIFAATVVAMHEATARPEYRILCPQEYENLQGILLMGLRRLTENETMPVSASTIAELILSPHITLIQEIRSEVRIRPNVDVYGSLRCVITTYMPAICALLQRTPTAHFENAFCQLFARFFYDINVLLVHISMSGYAGATMIYNCFIEELSGWMDSELNRQDVITLSRSMLYRVEDHIETAPCNPHQYVVRSDGRIACICDIDEQGSNRPEYRVVQREVMISLYENEPQGPPSYPAPRVGPQADREETDAPDSEMNTSSDENFTCEKHSHVCAPPAPNEDSESDNDSEGYISPIAPPVTQQPRVVTREEIDYNRMMNDATHFVTYDESTNEYEHRVILPPREIYPRSGVLPDAGYVHQPVQRCVPEPVNAQVAPNSPIPLVRTPGFTTIYLAPGYVEVDPPEESEEMYAPSAPEESKPATPEPEDASRATPASTVSTTEETTSTTRSEPPKLEVPKSEPAKRTEADDETGGTFMECTAATTIRAPIPNIEPTPTEDSAQSTHPSIEEFLFKQWQSASAEDAVCTSPQADQEALSDAYLAGMTPRRRKRALNMRPPQEAAAFIHDCVTSASEQAAEGAEGPTEAAGVSAAGVSAAGVSVAAGEAAAAGEASEAAAAAGEAAEAAVAAGEVGGAAAAGEVAAGSEDPPKDADDVFGSFYDYFRTLTAERALASEDYRPDLHDTVLKMLSKPPSDDEDDEPSPDK